MIHRRQLVMSLLTDRPDHLLAVSGLGSSTWDLSAAGNDAHNFCFIGAMGQAVPFALGLAIAQPDKRVVVVTGDGDMLMSMGVLATIANRAPANLVVLVLDNESYVETGRQPTATAGRTDLEAVARACGIGTTCKITQEHEVQALREMVYDAQGPVFANVKVIAESLPLVFPYSFDGVTAMNRFRAAVLGEEVS